MLVDQFLVDGADNFDVNLDGIEVQEGNTEFVRRGNRDCACLGKFLVDQVCDERDLCLLCGIGCLEELLLGDQPVLHKPPR